MIEVAREELRGWGGSWVSVSHDAGLRAELLLRFEGVSPVGAETTVLTFGSQGAWWVRQVTRVEVAPHLVVFDHGAGARTQVSRLVLPRPVERALHVGQFSTRALELSSIPTPFSKSHVPALSRARPKEVVVWTEFAAASRRALWWACASFPRARIWVVPVPRDRPDQEEVWCIRSAKELMLAAPAIQRLTSAQASRLAANWKAWARGEAVWKPVPLVRWPERDRWVGEVPNSLFDVFPRLDGTLRISAYDQALLELVGTEWSSTMSAIRRLLKRPDTRLMQTWGDMTLHRRLHAWSRWKRGRYVEARASQSDLAFSPHEYRLTDEGVRLLEILPSLEAAPPFEIGRFRLYSPGSWLRTPRGVTTSRG